MINTCLSDASDSIRNALALAEQAEAADTKARREDVLNQLLVLLNTSMAEKKLTFAEEEEIAAMAALEGSSREDDIEYIVGSLGLVPPSEE